MRRLKYGVVTLLAFFLSYGPEAAQSAYAAPPQKEWTMLVFLNGNNNLDEFGEADINEMENVGSSNDINVVVQWASMAKPTSQRLYIQKDSDTDNVTSPVVQDVGAVDMGDANSLVDFVKWGIENYPAKHYFIDIWNHGSGWHNARAFKSGLAVSSINDISFDDKTKNAITTVQLGQAMGQISQYLGRKIDIYGSDACLMAMAEVAAEMTSSVEIFAGSQELEPGDGWPYDTFLDKWTAKPTASASEVATLLAQEYTKSYHATPTLAGEKEGGAQGEEEVTFSAIDLAQLQNLNLAVASLGDQIKQLDLAGRAKVMKAARKVMRFNNDLLGLGDYADISDLARVIAAEAPSTIGAQSLDSIQMAVSSLVVANQNTSKYSKAAGVSVWLPKRSKIFKKYKSDYQGLQFQAETGWSEALEHLLQDTP